jgi:hypothetical protein
MPPQGTRLVVRQRLMAAVECPAEALHEQDEEGATEMARYAIPLGPYMADRLEPLGFRYSRQTKQWVIDNPTDEILKRVEKLHPQRLFEKDGLAERTSNHEALWIDKQFNNGHKATLEAAGARWDPAFGAWYIKLPSASQVAFLYRHGLTTESPTLYPEKKSSKIATMLSNAQAPLGSGQRVYLSIPYAERGVARSLGCFFDRREKKWYSLLDNPNLPYLKREFSERQAA